MATLNSYEGLLPDTPPHPQSSAILAGPPAEPTPLPEIVAALRDVTPLDGLRKRSTAGSPRTARSAWAPTAPSSSAKTSPPAT